MPCDYYIILNPTTIFTLQNLLLMFSPFSHFLKKDIFFRTKTRKHIEHNCCHHGDAKAWRNGCYMTFDTPVRLHTHFFHLFDA